MSSRGAACPSVSSRGTACPRVILGSGIAATKDPPPGTVLPRRRILSTGNGWPGNAPGAAGSHHFCQAEKILNFHFKYEKSPGDTIICTFTGICEKRRRYVLSDTALFPLPAGKDYAIIVTIWIGFAALHTPPPWAVILNGAQRSEGSSPTPAPAFPRIPTIPQKAGDPVV